MLATVTERFTALTSFAGAREGARAPGATLAAIREAAPDLKAEIRRSGVPDGVATCDLITLPYPTKFGLWRSGSSPAPFLWITNRMLVVQWQEQGRTRTLLWEPSDHERGDFTPYFARLKEKSPLPASMLSTVHGTVLGHLRAIGIEPADVDYLVFDHLHTQDVRRLVGTRGPAPDLGSPDSPVTPWFPNAVLVTQIREWESIEHLHPLQAPWYQPATYTDLPPERLLFIDGDVLLGPGVGLLSTPGHTYGNQSLLLHTETGIWTSSENGIAAESWLPAASKIRGVLKWALEWGQEVILNANTLELTAWQYDSMIAESLIADPTPQGTFLQTFPSSELTANRLSPLTAPTFTHGAIRHGRVRASAALTSR